MGVQGRLKERALGDLGDSLWKKGMRGGGARGLSRCRMGDSGWLCCDSDEGLTGEASSGHTTQCPKEICLLIIPRLVLTGSIHLM